MLQAFSQLEISANDLLDSALAIPVLVTRKRERRTPFERERKALRQRALARQVQEEAAVHERYLTLLQDSKDADADLGEIEVEERLVGSIHELKKAAFDQVVERQQLELITQRVQTSSAVIQEAKQEYKQNSGKSSNASFHRRDALVTEVLSQYRQVEELRRQVLEVERELREKQARARKLWRSRTTASQPKREDPSFDALSPADKRLLQQKNSWLRHLLTTIVLESKINWAIDPSLRSLMLDSSDV